MLWLVCEAALLGVPEGQQPGAHALFLGLAGDSGPHWQPWAQPMHICLMAMRRCSCTERAICTDSRHPLMGWG